MLWRVVGSVVGLGLLAAVVYFFYTNLTDNWTQFVEYEWSVRYGHVALSLAILFVVFAFSPVAWVWILRLQGERLGYLQAFVIFYLANLGKYIPGKLWGYGGQIYLTKRQGISIQHILVSTALLLVLDYFAGLALAAITLLAWHNVPAYIAVAGTALVVLLMALLSWSDRGLGLLRRGLARLKVTAFDDVPAGAALFRVWLFLMLRWVLLGVSFVIGIKGIIQINIVESIAYCSAFAWSHLLSMIVFVTPAGLGVREGLMVYLLEMVSTLPPWIAIGISVATRLWMSIMELICALPAIAVKKILK
jgi:hypothetical protein